jgi:hypothetical protein
MNNFEGMDQPIGNPETDTFENVNNETDKEQLNQIDLEIRKLEEEFSIMEDALSTPENSADVEKLPEIEANEIREQKQKIEIALIDLYKKRDGLEKRLFPNKKTNNLNVVKNSSVAIQHLEDLQKKVGLENKEVPLSKELFEQKIADFISTKGFETRHHIFTKVYKKPINPIPTKSQRFSSRFLGVPLDNDPRRSVQIGEVWYFDSSRLNIFGRENFENMEELAKEINDKFGTKIEVVLASERSHAGPILGNEYDQF